MRKLPEPSSGARKLLTGLLDGPGTFYQICERLDIDIESNRAEFIQRELLNRLVEGGHAYLVGLVYDITTPARNVLAPAPPYVGQVAGPTYRGTPHPMPVCRHYRRYPASDSLAMTPHFGRSHHTNFTHEREIELVAA